MERISQYIEALIFSAEEPVSIAEMRDLINETYDLELAAHEVEEELEKLMALYRSDSHSIHIVPIAHGYQFMTKDEYHDVVYSKLRDTHKKKLSKAAMETLAIIAYKQPVEKTEVEVIRGVNCDYTIQKLLEKDLVEIAGRSDKPGRPLIYKTSDRFMNYFGISGVRDLPTPKEFSIKENEIGESQDIEEFIIEEE